VEHASFVVRVGASGVSNTLDFAQSVNVFGPRVRYGVIPLAHFLRPGQQVGEFPEVIFWSAPLDVPLTWSYSVVEGSLPEGITLDPATGLIQGAPASVGEFSAQIQATLSTPFGSYRTEPTPWIAVVQTEGSFFYAGGPGTPPPADFVLPVLLGERLTLEPQAANLGDSGRFTDFRIESGGALPPGLALDPASGMIHGTPTALTGTTTYVISASKPSAGVRTQTSLAIMARAPVTIAYPPVLTALAGAPLLLRAEFSTIGFLPSTQVVVPRDGACTLPSGLVITPTSGTITGTTSVLGTFDCVVDVTFTYGSATWRQAAFFQLIVQ
jgi:hypothetical protein